MLDLNKISGGTNTAFIETTGLDFGEFLVKKTPRRFVFWVEGINVVKNMVLGISYRNNNQEDWREYSKTFDLTEGMQIVDIKPPAAMLFKFKLTDADINTNWKIVRLKILGTVEGERES